MSSAEKVTHSSLPVSISAAALALVLTACGTSGEETSESPAADNPSASAEASGAETDPASNEGEAPAAVAEFDDSALGEMNSYVFDLINESEPTEAADWEDKIDESFAASLPAEEFAEFINTQIQSGAPWELEGYAPESETASISVVSSSVGRFGMQLSIDPDTELINGFYFTNMPEAGESVESFDELEEGLEDLGVEFSMLVIEDGETLYENQPDEVMPLSSTAKLYVLYALVEAVEVGDADWEDTLVLTDELRSLPSGQIQDEDTGYEISVADAATAMISISDNTATDMILDYLGRETVEEAVADAGHHNPALLTPYLSTADMFHLQLADPELGEEYAEADEDRRREIVDDFADEVLEVDPSEAALESEPPEGIEWFATTEDIVAVHQLLAEAREDHPELTEILTTNPGLVRELEDPWWDDVAFKGGQGVAGELSGSWTVSDGERERTVVLLMQSESQAEASAITEPAFGLAQDAFSLTD